MTQSDSPDGNRLWAAMCAADKDALRPHMTLRHLPHGDIVTRADEEVKTVYLPVSADLANVVRFEDGRSGMATNVGREGVTGLAAFLAEEPCGWDVEAQVAGEAWALPADILRRRIDDSPDLLKLLLRLTHNNQVEAAQNAVCNALHTVTPRLARWLLTLQDRTGACAVRRSTRRGRSCASWARSAQRGVRSAYRIASFSSRLPANAIALWPSAACRWTDPRSVMWAADDAG